LCACKKQEAQLTLTTRSTLRKEAVPNKWRADGTHNTYQSQ